MSEQYIGNYRIHRLIGAGSMGTVYEAVHEQIDKRVALKVLHPMFSCEARVTERCLNEAKAANRVNHNGIVSVFEFGRTQDGSAYLVMEYLEGEALNVRLNHRPPGFRDDVLHIGRQLAASLAACHARGVVHRDLKPANIMLVRDPEILGGERAKLLDFGLAKIRAATYAVRQSTPGLVMGTPAYMAPEQIHNASRVDGKADVYSLAVILYQLVGGRPPFLHPDVMTLLNMHLSSPPPPLRKFAPTVPQPFCDLLMQMLDKDPASRPAMAAVVERLVVMDAPSATPPSGDIPTVEFYAESETEAEISTAATLRVGVPATFVTRQPRKTATRHRSLEALAVLLVLSLWPQRAADRGDEFPVLSRPKPIVLPLYYGPPAPTQRSARPGHDRKDHRGTP